MTNEGPAEEPVLLERRGKHLIVTINRPAARNAIDAAVAVGIEAGVDRLESDPELWVGIITGAPPAFCAGADLREVAGGNVAALHTKRGGFAGITSRDRTKPIIAAVEGPALAGGAEIALACDLIVAARNATFGIPEVKRSLVAGGGGLFRLGRKLPMNIAMECALTGDPITAEQAVQFGLVNVLCDVGRTTAEALALADRIVANAPLAVRLSRRVVLEATFAPDHAAWEASYAAGAAVAASADFAEGGAAFLQKRAPVWSGD